MGTILLVRPGTTDFDEEDRIVGTLDIPLNVRGQAEIADLARQLRDQAIDLIYSAPDESARQSAQTLGEHLDVKVKVLAELRNLDFGLWQGLPVEEVRRKHKRLFKHWQETPCAICPPAGETVEDVAQRVRKALKPVLKRTQRGAVVIVAPDPLRQVIRCHLTDQDLAQLWEHDSQKQWEVIEVP